MERKRERTQPIQICHLDVRTIQPLFSLTVVFMLTVRRTNDLSDHKVPLSDWGL